MQAQRLFSRLGCDGSGKILQRVGKLFRVEVGNGLRELEQLVERRLHRLVVFKFRQRGDESVEREHQTLGAAGLDGVIWNGTITKVTRTGQNRQDFARLFFRPGHCNKVTCQFITFVSLTSGKFYGFFDCSWLAGFIKVVWHYSFQIRPAPNPPPSVDFIFSRSLFISELPAHLTQCHGLPDQPRLRAVAIFLRAPMFRLGDALAVEFKNQFGMPGLENVRVNILVARDTSVGADVKILQIAHSRRRAVGARVIVPRVRAQPIFRRAVAAFARNAFADFEIFAAQIFRHFVQRRVADGAARVGGRVFDVQRVGDLFRARGRERGERPLRMKILQRPDEKLVLILPAAAVATGIRAGSRAEKFGRCFRAVRRARRKKNSGEKKQRRGDKLFYSRRQIG